MDTDAEGRPDCSFKGGTPGFIRLIDERTLTFPDYDGNGMFRSLGNIRANPQVGLLEIDEEQPTRLRMNGVATVHDDEPMLAELPGAQLIIRVRADLIFPNCPRYIPRMGFVEESIYSPRPDYTPPEPTWKSHEDIRDVVPRT